MNRPGLAETIIYLQAGFRLFFMQFHAARVFGDYPEDFWKSFWCALVIAPLFFLFYAETGGMQGGEAISGFRRWAGEGIGYVLQWVYWPLVMGYLVVMLDREDRYVRYVAAYNWSQVAPICLVLPVSLLAVQLQMEVVASAASTAIFVWSLFFRFHLLRRILGVDRLPAFLMTLGDQFLAILLLGTTQSVILAGG